MEAETDFYLVGGSLLGLSHDLRGGLLVLEWSQKGDVHREEPGVALRVTAGGLPCEPLFSALPRALP